MTRRASYRDLRAPIAAALGRVVVVAALLSAQLPAQAAEQQLAAPAPAPGSPGVFVGHAAVAAKLAAAIAAAKDPAISAMAITDQYLINEVHRDKPIAPPAIHPGWIELHLVLEGGATFVTGGSIAASQGKEANVIEGGVRQRIEKGDLVVVPPNTPHWYQQIDKGGVTVIEIRFIAPPAAAVN